MELGGFLAFLGFRETLAAYGKHHVQLKNTQAVPSEAFSNPTSGCKPARPLRSVKDYVTRSAKGHWRHSHIHPGDRLDGELGLRAALSSYNKHLHSLWSCRRRPPLHHVPKGAQGSAAGSYIPASSYFVKHKKGPEREQVLRATHPVKALGLEEMAVGTVQLPPSSCSLAVDGL